MPGAIGTAPLSEINVNVTGNPDHPNTRPILESCRRPGREAVSAILLDRGGLRKTLAPDILAVNNMLSVDGRPTAWVCNGHQRQAPDDDPDRVEKLIGSQ